MRCSVEPGGLPEGVVVGDHVEVPVSELPVGVLVARDGLHLHVDREQVVAAMGSRRADLLQVIASVETLAVDPPVMIGEAHHHGVNVTGPDLRGQFLDRQHPAGHRRTPSNSLHRRDASSREIVETGQWVPPPESVT